jgi:acetyltransferase-like isoleucine patch superfamily enzyme
MNINEIKYLLMTTPTVYGGPATRLKVEPGAHIQNALVNVACGYVRVGYGSFCGHNVSLLTGSHTLEGSRKRAPATRDITIGKFVWIASNATVLGPCTIGDRAVVAAGSVVPPRSVLEAGWMYAGVPVRKVRPAIDIRADAGTGPLLLQDLRKNKR